MRQKSVPEKEPATQVVKNIRRATRLAGDTARAATSEEVKDLLSETSCIL
jgi:hypothetical protein